MKFSTRQDIEAPVAFVFDTLARHDVYERAALRRGIDVRRRGAAVPAGVGSAWDVRFMLRGKERSLALEIVRFDPPTDLVVAMTSNNIEGAVTCELFALSRTRTRMVFALDVKPLTLPARLLIQSLRLTKGKLSARFGQRVAEMVADIETRYAASV